jgi:methylated-DNA-protein-cysteine methyltransferase related protein
VTTGATGFRARVIATLATVGPGQVVSYGDLAEQAGFPGAARAAGAVLAGNRPEERLAWWRVVYADGRLAPGHETEQARRLAAEGVAVHNGRVVSARDGFNCFLGRGDRGEPRREARGSPDRSPVLGNDAGPRPWT